ncbi:MAG: ComF family protein [Proteobacteria bacterium]|nr:ComF family protein [Pseudomonadota bacterium]
MTMIRDTLDALRHLIWPSRCASCDLLLESPEAFLCDSCHEAMRFVGEMPSPEAVDGMFSFFAYEGAVQSLIARWKYHEDYCARLALLSSMSERIDRVLAFVGASATVIPVPPHPRRLRERGFDPVWTFASKLSTQLSQAKGETFTLNDACLHRSRHTLHQAGLSAAERAQNLRGAFEIVDMAPERVILVDDVVTTGATLSACALVLRNAGAKRVLAMTLAATPQS